MNSIPKLHWIFIQAFIGIAIYFSFTNSYNFYALFKGGTTVLIVLIPLLYASRPFDRYTKLILIGLFFCLGGDLLLLDEAYFVFGLGSFLIAHLCFMLGFLDKESSYHPIGILLVLTMIGATYYCYLFNDLGPLKIPVLVYILVILLMAWRGFSLININHENRYKTIAIAVVLFMFSDAMIALNKFKFSFNLSSLLILWTYWTSIFLIARSTCLMMKSKSR